MLRLAVFIILSVQFQSCVLADEPRGYWPQWRGPNRDNASIDDGLLTQWPTDGPPLRWSVKGIGDGIAAVAVADGRVILLGDYDGEEYVTALDERTGHRLWAVPIGQAAGQSPLMRWLSQRTDTFPGPVFTDPEWRISARWHFWRHQSDAGWTGGSTGQYRYKLRARGIADHGDCLGFGHSGQWLLCIE